MKPILQIAIGVFLGTLASQSIVEVWRLNQERATRAAAEKIEDDKAKARHELSERIRTLLMRGRRENGGQPPIPPGFVPDDAETGAAGEN